ncbi:6138_t:CDS:2 [Racocetra fulgida]|uniref:6138_t:CDS:1 n=1 Tax=Racocetra fulgida TaxID=60492 RepID=A0A9N9FXY9_9GLOM|nr:6138_t:CDS:2 [Racocetra fulgida]
MNLSPSKSKLVEERNKKWHEIKKKDCDSIQAKIQIFLNTPIPLQSIGFKKNSSSKSSQPSSSVSTSLLSIISTFNEYEIQEKLCDIWQCDQSYRRSVRTTYVDIHINVFDNIDKIL